MLNATYTDPDVEVVDVDNDVPSIILLLSKAREIDPPQLVLVIDQIQHQRGVAEDGIMMWRIGSDGGQDGVVVRWGLQWRDERKDE